MYFFAKKCFFANNISTNKASDIITAASCSSCRDALKYVHIELKGQGHSLISGQGQLRSRVEPNRSYCMSVDASIQEKHIGTIPSALVQNITANNKFDFT